MRRLPQRPALPKKTVADLERRTAKVLEAENRADVAARDYAAARKAKWFSPVIEALREASGPGERCMFCCGSEASQVEHYRPKAVRPELAFAWSNYLWACGICNQAKGDRFDESRRIFEPMAEDPWELFFLDTYGNLRARVDPSTGEYFVRSEATMTALKLDREPLQESRKRRYRSLCNTVKELVDLYHAGQRTIQELSDRIRELIEEPSQPDVADFFLNGPGQEEQPFRALRVIVPT